MIKMFFTFLIFWVAAIAASCEWGKPKDVMIVNLTDREILVEYSYTDGVFRDPQILPLGIDALDSKTRNWRDPDKGKFEFDVTQARYRVSLPTRVALKLGTDEKDDPDVIFIRIVDGNKSESYESEEAVLARLRQEDWSIRYR